MSQDLIRLMHALFLPAASRATIRPGTRPPTCIARRDGWLVKFELAGVRPEDIELKRVGNRLTLRGVRRDCTAQKAAIITKWRSLTAILNAPWICPATWTGPTSPTDYRDGMLLVHIPEGGSIVTPD